MRLIDVTTLQLKEYIDADVPPYAILSHTWGSEEVTFQEMTLPQSDSMATPVPVPAHRLKAGYCKIMETARLAREMGIQHVWVDTCCIDKTSSAELTESINSMFRWYQEAQVCLAYLADLDPGVPIAHESLRECRWFTRGWTLQELLAPRVLRFYDRTWAYRGSKEIFTTELHAITGIERGALSGNTPIHAYSVATRMSWAAHRQTTRLEDTAYALLGIFDISLPLIYGEGKSAFRRLQEEIVRHNNDLTIFAWENRTEPLATGGMSNLFASSPAAFAWSKGIQCFERVDFDPEFTLTNKGLRMEGCLTLLQTGQSWTRYSLPLGARWLDDVECVEIGVLLRKVGPSHYVREGVPHELNRLTADERAVAPQTSMHRFFICVEGDMAHALERRALKGSVLFPWTAALPAIKQVVPEGHWDEARGLFFRPEQRARVFAVSATVTLDSSDINMIILVDHREVSGPALRVFNAAKYPRVTAWLFRQRHAAESVFWSDIALDFGELPKLTNQLTIVLKNKAFYITVSLLRCIAPSISVESELYSVAFDIDEGSRYSLGKVKRL